MFVEDVALITLDTPYVNPGLRPVCIPLQPKINSIDNKKWIGQLVEFSGWGFVNERCMHIINFVTFQRLLFIYFSARPDLLQHATLEIWDPEICSDQYGYTLGSYTLPSTANCIRKYFLS